MDADAHLAVEGHENDQEMQKVDPAKLRGFILGATPCWNIVLEKKGGVGCGLSGGVDQ
jgi:hypothetical protein